jgi:hypothetical protein
MTSREAQKKLHEKHAFLRFCDAAGLSIAESSIQQPGPPAPDILVVQDGIAVEAFELVRLDPEDQLTRHQAMLRSGHLLHAGLDTLPAPIKEQFQRLFRNFHISVSFNESSGIRDRRRDIPATLQLMLEHAGEDELRLERPAVRLPGAIAFVRAQRFANLDGPQFGAGTSGYVPRLNVSALKRKLLRTDYACDVPLSLLAYIDLGEVSHKADEDELPEVIRTHIASSAFQKVWLHESFLHRVTCFAR